MDRPVTWTLPDRLAYVVSHSYPWSSNGYAVRTHEIARALTGLGHEVIVINRPGRPWTIEGFPQDRAVPPQQVIDGVRYVVLPLSVPPEANLRTRLRRAEHVLHEAFGVFRPSAVLAASNWENAEPAQNAARRHGCAFFYEQRGFWEMSREAAEPGYAETEEYRRIRGYELRIARGAKAVFTLNAAMRRELVARGVPEGNIRLVPNGVPEPGPIDRTVTRAGLGCGTRHMLGYIGSLSEYEGVGDVIRLLARLRARGLDAGAMIVGSSSPKGLIGSAPERPQEAQLRALAAELGVAAQTVFVPQVPWDRIGAYYSLCDALVMPRRRSPLTELVAPLKPYAAAAYSVPTFLPDMPPMDEIAQDLPVSLYPEGDLEALSAMVAQALTGGHPALTETLSPALQWSRRVAPLSQALRAEAGAARQRLAGAMGAGLRAQAGTAATQEPETPPAFDLEILPEVMFRRGGSRHVAAIGPLPAEMAAPGTRVTALDRVNILGVLATGDVGDFVINWRALPDEWAGLWSIDNMRLNRQIMDACRIAQTRGWRMRVLGPVSRSHAPLYRTVARVLEEVDMSSAPTPAPVSAPVPTPVPADMAEDAR